MSYLDHFLKESGGAGGETSNNIYNNVLPVSWFLTLNTKKGKIKLFNDMFPNFLFSIFLFPIFSFLKHQATSSINNPQRSPFMHQQMLTKSPSSVSQQQQYSNQHIYHNQPTIGRSNCSLENDDAADIENDLHMYSFNSSRSNLSDSSMDQVKPQKIHQFLVRSFSTPTKCNHCTSLMVRSLLN